MKLTKCTPYVVKNVPPYNGGMYLTYIKLETDEGIVGWGETASARMLFRIPRTFPVLIESIFEEFFKGRDALAREKLMAEVVQVVALRHTDLFMGCILSAFDTALWDIAGKAANMPVYQMLGGKFRDKLHTYTYIYPDDSAVDSVSGVTNSWSNADLVVRSAAKFVEQGYTALKFDPIRMIDMYTCEPLDPRRLTNQEIKDAEKVIAALKKEYPDVDLLIGTHGQMTTASAIRLGTMLSDYDCMWFEEPVPPDNVKEMAKVAHAVKVPVATGERLAGIADFQRLFEEDGCAIAQPDIGTMGGLTYGRKVAAMAEPKYIQMAPHNWGSMINLAVTMQLDFACPNFLIQEIIGDGNEFFMQFADQKWNWKDGYLYPFEGPGLGVNLNEDLLKKYSC